MTARSPQSYRAMLFDHLKSRNRGLARSVYGDSAVICRRISVRRPWRNCTFSRRYSPEADLRGAALQRPAPVVTYTPRSLRPDTLLGDLAFLYSRSDAFVDIDPAVLFGPISSGVASSRRAARPGLSLSNSTPTGIATRAPVPGSSRTCSPRGSARPPTKSRAASPGQLAELRARHQRARGLAGLAVRSRFWFRAAGPQRDRNRGRAREIVRGPADRRTPGRCLPVRARTRREPCRRHCTFASVYLIGGPSELMRLAASYNWPPPLRPRETRRHARPRRFRGRAVKPRASGGRSRCRMSSPTPRSRTGRMSRPSWGSAR